jgi:hypothetical protein
MRRGMGQHAVSPACPHLFRRQEGTCPVHTFLLARSPLGRSAPSLPTKGGVDVRVAEYFLYGDQIDVVIKHVAGDGAANVIRREVNDAARWHGACSHI